MNFKVFCKSISYVSIWKWVCWVEIVVYFSYIVMVLFFVVGGCYNCIFENFSVGDVRWFWIDRIFKVDKFIF